MAYEREAIVASTTPTDQSIAHSASMREERVFEPYKGVTKPPTGGAVGQTTTSEAVEPKKEEAVALSPQMAALARKEQKLRQDQQALAKEREAVAAERAETAQLKDLKAKLAAKDYSGIEDVVKYDDYTNYLIEKTGSQDPTQEKLKSLESKIDGVEKSRKEETEKQFAAAVAQRKQAVLALVESKPEFSAIKKAKYEDAVVQHILDTWEHDSIDLDPETAAKEVQKVLLEKRQKWIDLIDDQPKTEEPKDTKQLPPLKQAVKTLTNNMTATEGMKRPTPNYSLMKSDEERWAAARRAAEEKLKLKG